MRLHERVGGLDERTDLPVAIVPGPKLDVPHEFAGSLEDLGWIDEVRSDEEAHVDVRGEDPDIGERRLADARGGLAVVNQLPHVVPTSAHPLEPPPRDPPELPRRPFEPR